MAVNQKCSLYLNVAQIQRMFQSPWFCFWQKNRISKNNKSIYTPLKKYFITYLWIYTNFDFPSMQSHQATTPTKYSLRSKMIVLHCGFFLVLKWLSGLSAWLEIWGSKSTIFAPNFLYEEVFWHFNFQGHFGVVDVLFIYLRVILITTRSMVSGP